MNTFLKNSFIRHFDVRGVKMGQGQNVSFSFSNDGGAERGLQHVTISPAQWRHRLRRRPGRGGAR